MPLYEYRCKNCGHQFEKIQSFSAPDEKECSVCHGELERLISAPAVQFKGSGFYSTDYPSKSSKAPSTGEGGDSKSKGSEAAGTSDKSAGNSGGGSPSSTDTSSPSSTPASSSAKKE